MVVSAVKCTRSRPLTEKQFPETFIDAESQYSTTKKFTFFMDFLCKMEFRSSFLWAYNREYK